MKKLSLATLLIIVFCGTAFAQKRKVITKYKTYEKFDFEAMDIGGDKSSPGDLSIDSRIQTKFKNKIPQKPNFVPEMKASIDAVL